MGWWKRAFIVILFTVSGTLSQDCCHYDNSTRVFSCYDCDPLLTSIPDDMPIEAEEVQINNQNIEKLGSTDLTSMVNLKRLYLRGNNMTQIDDHVLLETPDLRVLDLSDNLLTSLPPNLPASLTMLYLGANYIRDLDDQSFPDLPDLYRLELAVDQVEEHILTRMPNLRELWIEVCRIGAYAFSELVELDWLTVRSPCPYPDLYGQTLNMEPFAFSNIPQVFDIWVHFEDGMGVVPENAFTDMSVLNTVSLSACGLEDIQSGALRDLLNLDWFHIMPCDQEETIPPPHKAGLVLKEDTFQNTPYVKHVHLKGLSLAAIEPHTFSNFYNLLVLRMDGVGLTALHQDVLLPISISLQLISLGLNPWNCDCELRWLKEWTDASMVVEDRYQLQCDTPPELHGQTFFSLQPEDFVCPI